MIVGFSFYDSIFGFLGLIKTFKFCFYLW